LKRTSRVLGWIQDPGAILSSWGGSDFRDGDRRFRADLDAGLAAEALVGVDGIGFVIDQLEHLSGTGTNAFFAASTFVFVYNYLVHSVLLL
jgi:hypothetical protein